MKIRLLHGQSSAGSLPANHNHRRKSGIAGKLPALQVEKATIKE